MKKLILPVFSALFCLFAALPALADVPVHPLLTHYSSDGWLLWLAAGIALIALGVLIYLVIKARREK